LIVAGLQTDAVAGMVVKHGQRMAPAAVAERHMTLEVHLPEQVRGGLLEALMGSCATDWHDNAVVPAQDLVHGRDRRRAHPVALKTVRNLARSPGRMRVAQRQNALLDKAIRLLRARMGTTRTIHHLPIGCPAPKPLVTRCRVNPEPPT